MSDYNRFFATWKSDIHSRDLLTMKNGSNLHTSLKFRESNWEFSRNSQDVYEDVYNFRFHERGEFSLLNLEPNASSVWTVDTSYYIWYD